MKVNFTSALVAVGLVFSTAIFADQIENESKEAALASAPQGVMVKVNPATKTVEVFQVKTLDTSVIAKAVPSDIGAVINSVETSANKIAEFKLATNPSELEKEASTEAWYRRWYGYNYNWYGWGGYRPYYYNWYRPYYYNPGYFTYGYSYRYNYAYSYGYNNCNYGWYY